MRYKISSFYCCFLLFCSSLFAQTIQYTFLHLDHRNGLSNNHVTSILKDSRGFIWFGTQSGLNRFDGYEIKVFKNDPQDSTSLQDNFVVKLVEDSDGNIWIQSEMGKYSIYNPHTESFQNNTSRIFKELKISSVNPNKIVFIHCRDGNSWFLEPDNGIYKKVSGNRIVQITHNPADTTTIFSNNISDLNVDSKGFIWIIGVNGIIEKLNGKTFHVVYRNYNIYKILTHASFNLKIFIDSDDNPWFYTDHEAIGAFFLKQASNTLFHFNKKSNQFKLSSDIITGIVQDNAERIWISTDEKGINIINKNNYSLQLIQHDEGDQKSLCQNSITSLCKDDQGIIWIGTYKKGINYFHKNISKFKIFTHRDYNPASLPYDEINCFAEDTKGNLWIGTNGGGLIYFDRHNGKYTQYRNDPNNPSSLSSNIIVSMFFDSDQKLWIGTYFGGMNCFDGKNFIHFWNDPSNQNSIANDNVWAIFEDSKKNMWIGTLYGGYDLFDKKKKVFIHHRENDQYGIHRYVATIAEDMDNDLWFGAADGIEVYNSRRNCFINFAQIDSTPGKLSYFDVTKIFADSRNLIWIGTRDGLNMYNKRNQTFTVFKEKDGLPDNSIMGILEDNNGNLWISTSYGLSHLIISTDSSVKKYKFTFINYDETDGLQGNEFNTNSSFKTKKGELIFGGPNGFNLFTPEEIYTNKNIPDVKFIDFQIDYRSIKPGEKLNNRVILTKSISETKTIILSSNEKTFSIEFAAVGFFDPGDKKYKYILDGFDKKWITTDSKSRIVTYTNLDPGTYFFRVKASNEEGLWGNKTASLTVRVLAPWWQTWWFKLFILILIIIMGIGIFYLRVAIYRTRQTELESQVKKRTIELENTNEILLEGQTRIEEQTEELEIQTETLKEINKLLMEKQKTIANQSETLKETNQQLSILNSTKDRFFSIIAHDLRNPFNVVIGFSELLMRNFKVLPYEKAEKYINFIQTASKNGNTLLENLLQWSRAQTGRISFDPVRLNLAIIIEETLTILNADAHRKNITINQLIDPTTEIFADEDMLKTIFRNLISNAIKFSNQNGLIEISGKPNHSDITVIVADNGVGIKKENIDLLFRIDVKYSTAGTANETGTGLGLIICKEFIDKHNGKIWVESEEGKGSKFIFKLPAHQ